MVEMQVRETESAAGKESTTNIDVTEIIGKISQFVDQIRDMSGNGKPMDVKVDSFNFSVGKMKGEYTLTFNSKIAIKPKEN